MQQMDNPKEIPENIEWFKKQPISNEDAISNWKQTAEQIKDIRDAESMNTVKELIGSVSPEDATIINSMLADWGLTPFLATDILKKMIHWNKTLAQINKESFDKSSVLGKPIKTNNNKKIGSNPYELIDRTDVTSKALIEIRERDKWNMPQEEKARIMSMDPRDAKRILIGMNARDSKKEYSK